jgi:hypothetical protein
MQAGPQSRPSVRGIAKAQDILDSTWGRGNTPYNRSLTVEEPLLEELGIKRCRSFRADLHHKLRIIIKVDGTAKIAARRIGVGEDRISKWLNLKAFPGRETTFLKIDSAYEYAVEKLRLQKLKKKKN